MRQFTVNVMITSEDDDECGLDACVDVIVGKDVDLDFLDLLTRRLIGHVRDKVIEMTPNVIETLVCT